MLSASEYSTNNTFSLLSSMHVRFMNSLAKLFETYFCYKFEVRAQMQPRDEVEVSVILIQTKTFTTDRECLEHPK